MADIVLKNYAGENVTYSGVEQIELNTADGGTQIFSLGGKTELSEITVTPTGTEFTVTAEDGKGYSAVTVKPAYLTVASVDDLPADAKDGMIAVVEG